MADDIRISCRLAVCNLKRIIISAKFLVVLFCLIIITLFFYNGLGSYLRANGKFIQNFELFIATNSSMKVKWIPYLGFLLLTADIPFVENGSSSYLIRANRKSWLLGQVISVVCLAVIYMAINLLLYLAVCIPQVTFANQWSEPIFNAARSGYNGFTSIGIAIELYFPMAIIKNCTPLSAFFLSILLSGLLYTLTGFIYAYFKLMRKPYLGYAAAMLLLGFDYIVTEVLLKNWCYYISPFTLSRLMELDLPQNGRLPTVPYATALLLILNILFLVLFAVKARTFDYFDGEQ